MGHLHFYQIRQISKFRLGMFVLVLMATSYASASKASDSAALPALPTEAVSTETEDSGVDRKPGFSPVADESDRYNGNYLDYATEAQVQAQLPAPTE